MFLSSKPSTYATLCIATGYYRIYLNSEPSERVSRSKLSDFFIPIALGLRGADSPSPIFINGVKFWVPFHENIGPYF